MAETNLNKELFLKIADAIEAEPGCYDQSSWYSTDSDLSATLSTKTVPCLSVNQGHTCGTKACIAGWAVALTPLHDRPDYFSISLSAEQLLGLSDDQSSYLFHPRWEPKDGMTVPQCLREIAHGRIPIDESGVDFVDEGEWEEDEDWEDDDDKDFEDL